MSVNMRKYIVSMVGMTTLVPLLAMAQPNAAELLQHMQKAASQLSYEGKVAYQQGSELSVLHIQQQQKEGGVETTVYVDGDEDKSPVTSFSMKSHVSQQSSEAYSFDLGNIERVADHSCQVVVARPKDRLRYLYRYCIEPDTGQLLKYSLTGEDRQLVEQMVFTEITIDNASANPNDLVRQDVMPQLIQADDHAIEMMADVGGVDDNSWEIKSLPIGFEKANELKKGDESWQLIVSDGMTSVSIFIKPWDGKDEDNVNYSSGAMNILTQKHRNYRVTSIGEVPKSTLQQIVRGLHYVSP